MCTRELNVGGPVGFDKICDQFVNTTVSKEFAFNIMCIGETGIGKTTLINSLFNTNFEELAPNGHDKQEVGVKSQTFEIKEMNVQLNLTIAETTGYKDQINGEDNYHAIVNYLDEQFEHYLEEEMKVDRCIPLYQDTRVHACLYFIAPTGHGLKSIDLVCMKQIHEKVNIIPIIAKADSISRMDVAKFKKNINSELEACGIKIYKFPIDDESVAERNALMNNQVPFAVVGSNEFANVGNKRMRARQYPWGIVEVENEAHCDFAKLREMLIRTNMEDLRETTHEVHYEFYRRMRLEQMGFEDNAVNSVQTRNDSLAQEQMLQEEEIKQKFYDRVRLEEAKLKQYEKEMKSKFITIKQHLEDEISTNEAILRQVEQDMYALSLLKLERSGNSPTVSTSGSKFSRALSLGALMGKRKSSTMKNSPY